MNGSYEISGTTTLNDSPTANLDGPIESIG